MFLTPLKPPTKASISIEAVQSSLYFLHVERPEDEDLRKSLEATKTVARSNNEALSIQRKPLPSTPHANYPPSAKPPTPPKSYPHYQPPLPESKDATQAERHAARGANLRLRTTDLAKPSGMQRKPVGARLMPIQPIPETSTFPKEENDDSPASAELEERPFRLSRKPVQLGSPLEGDRVPTLRTTPEQPFPDASSPALGQGRESDRSSSGAMRITLIRRDPASGSQWNVGSIIPHRTVPHGNPLRKVGIELNTPGYTKFAQQGGMVGHGFNRTVDYMLVPTNDASSITRQRSNSSESFSNSANPNSKKPRQVYSFTSPWQGVCAFSNGLDGRSLRCRHTLPPKNSSMSGVAADIAELRFNLPWSILRPRDPNKQPTELAELSPNAAISRPTVSSNKEEWRRSFQLLTHKARTQFSQSESSGNVLPFRHARRNPVSRENAQDPERMNFDLAREKAGGGFKGHSAKLGKLIIDDEGLKMCDLVVAACMGVWWQHYAGDLMN